MQTNEDKIAALRRGIIAEIVALMKENNRTEIELNTDDETPEGLCDPIYVLWADNDGDWYEAPVKKVILEGDGINLYCDNRHGSVHIESYEFACNHLGWLEEIRQGIIKTLGITEKTLTAGEELIRLRDEVTAIHAKTLGVMYRCVDETPEQELNGEMSYLTSDEDRDKCCIVGFEIRNEVLNAVLEYEYLDGHRRVPVGSLCTEEALSAMLSMLK